MPKDKSSPTQAISFSAPEKHHKPSKRKHTKNKNEHTHAKYVKKRKATQLEDGNADAEAASPTLSPFKHETENAKAGAQSDSEQNDHKGFQRKKRKRGEKEKSIKSPEQNAHVKVANTDASGHNVISLQHTAPADDKGECEEELVNTEPQQHGVLTDLATDFVTNNDTIMKSLELRRGHSLPKERQKAREGNKNPTGITKGEMDSKSLARKKTKRGEKRKRTSHSKHEELKLTDDERPNIAAASEQLPTTEGHKGLVAQTKGKKRKYDEKCMKTEPRNSEDDDITAMDFLPKRGTNVPNSNMRLNQLDEERDAVVKDIPGDRMKRENMLDEGRVVQTGGKFQPSQMESKIRNEGYGNDSAEPDPTRESGKDFWKRLRKEGDRAAKPQDSSQNKKFRKKAKTGDESITVKRTETRESDNVAELEMDMTTAKQIGGNKRSVDDDTTIVTGNGPDIDGSRKKEDERMERTLFVGNVPLNAMQKDVKKLFKPFGNVETVRLRGVVPENPKIPKKTALLTGRLAKFADSHYAYVVFKKDQDFEKAMKLAVKQLNMSIFRDHHIRVMPAGSQKRQARRVSLFVGNLPFDCKEEELIQTFSEPAANLGVEVVNVRVSKDKGTGVGKGVGFVTFNDSLGIQGCLNEAGNLRIRGRIVRMEAAAKEKKLNAKTTKKEQRAARTGSTGAIYWHRAATNFRAKKN